MSSGFAGQFSSRLHELRRARSVTQTALSRLTSIHQPRLSQFERGETVPSVEELMAIAQALDVEVLDLMGVENAAVGSSAASRRLAKLLESIPPSDRQLLMQIAELMAKRADPEA